MLFVYLNPAAETAFIAASWLCACPTITRNWSAEKENARFLCVSQFMIALCPTHTFVSSTFKAAQKKPNSDVDAEGTLSPPSNPICLAEIRSNICSKASERI